MDIICEQLKVDEYDGAIRLLKEVWGGAGGVKFSSFSIGRGELVVVGAKDRSKNNLLVAVRFGEMDGSIFYAQLNGVKKEYQHQGIGKQLGEFNKFLLRGRGVEVMKAGCDPFDEEQIAFVVNSQGYTITGYNYSKHLLECECSLITPKDTRDKGKFRLMIPQDRKRFRGVETGLRGMFQAGMKGIGFDPITKEYIFS